jgi:hypothetical protein
MSSAFLRPRSFSDGEYNSLYRNRKRERDTSLDRHLSQRETKRIKIDSEENVEDKNTWFDTFLFVFSHASMFMMLLYIIIEVYYPLGVKMFMKM